MRKKHKNLLAITCIILLPIGCLSQDFSELIDYLRDAKIIGQDNDNTYLGKLSNEYDSESIFNEYGDYGSEYSSSSIWNKYSTLGNKYSSYSPFNMYSSTPPILIKNGKIIAYLTVNKTIKGAVSPNLLKALKDQF